jgi:acyl-CoA oxidase
MLPQQVIKVLLKLVEKVQLGDTDAIKDYEQTDMEYLIQPLQKLVADAAVDSRPTKSSFVFSSSSTSDEFLDTTMLLEAFRHRTACMLLDVAMQLQKSMETCTPQQAWNDCLLTMSRASRAHACYLLLRDFSEGLKDEQQKGGTSCMGENEISVLSQCLSLLALYWMDQQLSDFLQIQCMSASHVPLLRRALLNVMTKLRPSAVGLCDARDFSDFRLKSALGRYDGDVYPAIINAAKNDPLNRQSSPEGVGMGYNESLKKLIAGGVGEYRGISGTTSRL